MCSLAFSDKNELCFWNDSLFGTQRLGFEFVIEDYLRFPIAGVEAVLGTAAHL